MFTQTICNIVRAKIDRHDNRLAIVANRVKTNTLVFKSLMKFLGALDIPLAGLLRDTQHYVHAAAAGLGVHELSNVQRKELTQWIPLIDWVERGTVQPQTSLYGDRPSAPSNVTSLDSIRPRRVVGSRYN